jgi:hypothetical protein
MALTVLQTLYLFCVRSLPTEDDEQRGGTVPVACRRHISN